MRFSKKDKAFFEVSAWSLASLNEAANEKITLYFEEKGILQQPPLKKENLSTAHEPLDNGRQKIRPLLIVLNQ